MQDLTKYKLIRSKRRSVSLEITAEGAMIVRAPLRFSEVQIQQFIHSKTSWIEKITWQQKNRVVLQIHDRIETDSAIPFFGKWYPVRWVDQKSPAMEEYCNLPRLWQGELASRKLIRWFKTEAKKFLTQRTKEWSDYYTIPFQSVTITSAKKRLGSCNRKKEIRYTWRIMMLPPELIDYIILHELAHIKVHSHNKDFWELIIQWLPNLPALKKELQRYLIA